MAAATESKELAKPTNEMKEASSEAAIKCNANERIKGGMGHGERMRAEPDYLNVGVFVDDGKTVADEEENVKGQPAEGKGDHAKDQHFYHLVI